MLNEYSYQGGGFYLNRIVEMAIGKGNNPLLAGLWDFIGDREVCIYESDSQTVDKKAVEEMFSTDPIALKLMKAVICYNANAIKISMHQEFRLQFDGENPLNKYREPYVVAAPGSRFIAVISRNAENRNELQIHFWDLTRTS